MLPLGSALEAHHDHIMVHVVSGVLDGYVPEQTAVCPKNVIRPGPHLPALPEHAPITTIPRPWDASLE